MCSGSGLIRPCKHGSWEGMEMGGANPCLLELGAPPRFTLRARWLGWFHSPSCPARFSPTWLWLAELRNWGTLKARWFVRAELTLSQRRNERIHSPASSLPRPHLSLPGSGPSQWGHTDVSPDLDLCLPHTHWNMKSQLPGT